MYIDTHCHIYQEYYDDIDKVIRECRDHNCSVLVVNGCDLKSSQETLNIADKYPEVYAAIGFHPTELSIFEETWYDWLIDHLNNQKVVAIGEIGLDYHYDDTDKEKENAVFEKQLSIAEAYHLPVIIHSRDATEDTIKILKKYHLKGIIHSFSGSIETAKEYIRLGYKLGINGVITFKNSHLKEVVKELGLKYFVIETDSPYLTPEPHRGEKNYPYNVQIIVEFLSDYLDIPTEEILKITNANALDILSKIII